MNLIADFFVTHKNTEIKFPVEKKTGVTVHTNI